MRQFFKFMTASCFGVFLAGFALFSIGGISIGRMVASQNQSTSVSANSLLTLKLNKMIPEKTNNVEMSIADFKTDPVVGLHDIVKGIEYAKDDNNIKGIFMDLTGVSTGQATASVIRNAIEDFKTSGKFVIAFSSIYSQGAYYLASAADKIYINEIGAMDFRGFGAQIPFMKDMLDRLGIKAQVYYAGKFKSATEPLRRNNMSEANRTQTREYLEGMYSIFLDDISVSRNIEKSRLREIADQYLVRNSDDAVKYNLVDEKAYRDEVYDAMRKRIGLDADDKLKSVDLDKYVSGRIDKGDISIKDKIAVVIAEGSIVDGKGENGSIGGARYAKIIRKIREDGKHKAIVLRVNSGGGSGMASDDILRELIRSQEEGMPVVVSMGDMAASGGYFIACHADSIFAEPNTITGSIGVFGVIPSLEGMLKDKVGISFDTVKTGKYAVPITGMTDLSADEGQIIQEMVDEFYDIFLDRVSSGRNMSVDAVHEVAQGRVWTGKKALELGLIDAIGGLDDAIASAADKAGLTNYRVSEFPKIKDPVEQLVEKLTGQQDNNIGAGLVKSELGELYEYYELIKTIKEVKGVQAKAPFLHSNF